MAKKIDKEVKENQEIYKFATDNGMTLAQARQYYTPNDPLKETAKAATSKKATTPQPSANVITKSTSTSTKPANYSNASFFPPSTKTANYSNASFSPNTQPIYNPYYNYDGHDPINNPTHNQRVWLYADSIGDEALKDAAHQAEEASRSAQGFSGGVDGSQRIALTNQYGDFSFKSAPVFYDAYGNKIADQRNKILNREAFSYNPEEDPLFAVYQAQYNREGNRATQNTIGEMAARTGGMASSYAGTAAAQAGQYYAQQLADRIPELQQLAYSMYMDDLNSGRQDLAMLEGASDRDYGRFMDSYGMWSNDRDFAYGGYRDQVGDKQWQETRDRNVLESDRNFGLSEKQFEENTRMNDFSINSQAQENAKARLYDMIVNGGVTAEEVMAQAPELFEVSGLTTVDLTAYETIRREALAAQQATSRGSGGSGGSNTPTYNQLLDMYEMGIKTPQSIEWFEDGGLISPETADEWRKEVGGTSSNFGDEWDALKASYAQDGLTLDMDSILASAGAVSPEELERKIESGEIVESKVGNVIKFIKNPAKQKNYGNIYPW